ncbi:MAG: Ig-like domain-containing protein [Vicinamibacterales bacterium]
MPLRFRLLARLALAVALVALASACGSLLTASPVPLAIAVNGAAPAKGGTSQLRVVAAMSDGTSQDVTSASTFTSSDVTIGTVSATGVVTGIASGTVTITATYQGLTAVIGLTIP